MEPTRASMTALGVAWLRARHLAEQPPPIFSDTLAMVCIAPDEVEVFNNVGLDFLATFYPDLAHGPLEEQLKTSLYRYPATSMVVTRARHCEDLLSAAVERGVRQYVIIGAGFDTFAWRRQDLARALTVFEVDHPDTQALKRERIAGAGLALPPNLYFTPADFEHDSVATALARVPFDPAQRTLFSWHGVTYYLTREAIDATFRAVRSVASPGSDLVFDYWDTAHYTPESRTPAFHSIAKLVESWGEPFLTSFSPDQLRAELPGFDFQVVEDVGSSEFEERYFGGRTDALIPDAVHRCCVARAV